MDEDGHPPTRKDDIGGAGQVAAVEAEAVAHGVEHSPNDHFRRRIARSDSRHWCAAAFGGAIVGHGADVGGGAGYAIVAAEFYSALARHAAQLSSLAQASHFTKPAAISRSASRRHFSLAAMVGPLV